MTVDEETRVADIGSGTAQGADRIERRMRIVRRVMKGILALFPGALVPFLAFAAAGDQVGSQGGSGWRLAAGAVVSVVLGALTARIVLARVGQPLVRARMLVWGSFLLVLATVALLDVTINTLMLAGLWWGCAILVASRRESVAFAVLLLFVPWLRVGNGALLGYSYSEAYPEEQSVVILAGLLVSLVLWTALVGLGNWVWMMMWDITNEAISAREAQAQLAVSEERLRFARDMHDLLGHSLSGIAVQSELAARLVERDPQRAASEMLTVQNTAREALREVRSAVSNYREVDFASEMRSVCAVLTAAGVSCTVTGGDADLPRELRGTVGWLVREAGTNVLRHSRARHCEITLRREERAVTIEVYNDGLTGANARFQAPDRAGNGLAGLEERTAAVGGTLSASRSGTDGFLVRAVLPLRQDTKSGENARAEWSGKDGGA